jgi:hypothetical protein
MTALTSKPALVLLVALVAGCAKPPGSIPPVAVSTSNYDSYSCSKLSAEINENQRELADAERRQKNAVAGDAVGVAFILIPPSAFTGDASADVALNKGEDLAMRGAFNSRCVIG